MNYKYEMIKIPFLVSPIFLAPLVKVLMKQEVKHIWFNITVYIVIVLLFEIGIFISYCLSKKNRKIKK